MKRRNMFAAMFAAGALSIEGCNFFVPEKVTFSKGPLPDATTWLSASPSASAVGTGSDSTPTPTPTPTPLPLWGSAKDFLSRKFPEGAEIFLGGKGKGVHYYFDDDDADASAYLHSVTGINSLTGSLIVQLKRIHLGKYPMLEKDPRSDLPLIPVDTILAAPLEFGKTGNSLYSFYNLGDMSLRFRESNGSMIPLGVESQYMEEICPFVLSLHCDSTTRKGYVRSYISFETVNFAGYSVESYRKQDRTLILYPGYMDVTEIVLDPQVPLTYLYAETVYPYGIPTWFLEGMNLEYSYVPFRAQLAIGRDRAFWVRTYKYRDPISNDDVYQTSVWWGFVKEIGGEKILRLSTETKIQFFDGYFARVAVYENGRINVLMYNRYKEAFLLRFPESLIIDPPVATESLQ